MISKSHHFFLLSPSSWPLLLSFMSFGMFFSLLLMFKYSNYFLFNFWLFLTFMGSMFWWMGYSNEFSMGGLSSSNLEGGVKFGMILFICSEIFFFFSFFWGYFQFFLSPSMEIGLSWPPQNLVSFDFKSVPLINTVVLLLSGMTVTVSHFYFNLNEMKMSLIYLKITIMLGMFFTYLQGLEYSNSFFCLSDGNFGTVFFMLTGFHGIHVIIGSSFLLTVLIRWLKMISYSLNSISFEMSSWYWHFVDVVWIFLYFFLYYLPF